MVRRWLGLAGVTAVMVPLLLAGAAGAADGDRSINVLNGDFEMGETMDEIGWTAWSRDDLLSMTISDDARQGRRSLHLHYPDVAPQGYFEWRLDNQGRQDVMPGQVWTASAWVKYENTERVAIEFVAVANGEDLAPWGSGYHVAYGTGDWRLIESTGTVPPGAEQIYVRLSGSSPARVWVDDVRLREGPPRQQAPRKEEVRGWAYDRERVTERLGRGLFAMPQPDGAVYLRWRLLREDGEEAGFDIYRSAGGGEPVKLNDRPITRTTDFVDGSASLEVENVYTVQRVGEDMEADAGARFTVPADPQIKPYLSIKLDREDTTFQKVAIADLNGDGRYDFIIKTPNVNVDPYHRNWRPSERTYQLEAYLSDGTFLWRKDLGPNIETGIWYSPFVAFDFDGDGRAEMAVKVGPAEVDLRDGEPCEHGLYPAGRVVGGPEYVAILDGMTGEEKARAEWPSREGLGSYNHYSRNQMGVAYLDGKTPCLLLARGTYTVMKLHAYQFHGGRLERLWTWESSEEPGGLYYGQGGHTMHAVDLTGDGRDDVLLGACALDSNGNGLWSTNFGHPDNLWVGNLDPTRPGLEVYFGIEGARVKGSLQNGVALADAATGEILWGLEQRTWHVHGSGLASNIDPRHQGVELYSSEQVRPQRWLHTAGGELIADESSVNWGLSPRAVYWDATPERELLVRNRIFKFLQRQVLAEHIEGHQAAWLDLFGDWREEVIVSIPGELRIYMTDIPAEDRRVALMQDPLYRNGVAHMSMGYGQPPLTSYYIGWRAPSNAE